MTGGQWAQVLVPLAVGVGAWLRAEAAAKRARDAGQRLSDHLDAERRKANGAGQ